MWPDLYSRTAQRNEASSEDSFGTFEQAPAEEKDGSLSLSRARSLFFVYVPFGIYKSKGEKHKEELQRSVAVELQHPKFRNIATKDNLYRIQMDRDANVYI